MGDSERALALMDTHDEETRQYAWPAIAEEATELAIDVVKRMAGVDRCCVALGRIVRSLTASGDKEDRAWAAHLLEFAVADADAAEAEAQRHDAANAETARQWREAAFSAQAAVAQARIALGDHEAAERWLIKAAPQLASDPELLIHRDRCEALAAVQIGVGRYDEAEEPIEDMVRSDIRDQSRLALVKVYLGIGELERAAVQAQYVDPSSDEAVEAYILMAEHAEWPDACRWLCLALHHGEWTRALPTLLWAEPTTAQQAIDACRFLGRVGALAGQGDGGGRLDALAVDQAGAGLARAALGLWAWWRRVWR